MAGSLEEDKKKFKSGTEDSEDESEILEESPCGRWLKRREVVILCFYHPPTFFFKCRIWGYLVHMQGHNWGQWKFNQSAVKGNED